MSRKKDKQPVVWMIFVNDKNQFIPTDIFFMNKTLAIKIANSQYGLQCRNRWLVWIPFIGKRFLRWTVEKINFGPDLIWQALAILHYCECGADWCEFNGVLPAIFIHQTREIGGIIRHEDCDTAPEENEKFVGKWECWQAWTKVAMMQGEVLDA